MLGECGWRRRALAGLLCAWGLLVGGLLPAVAQAADDPWADILGDEGSATPAVAPTESFSVLARFQSRFAADTRDDGRSEDLFESESRIALEFGYQRGEWLRIGMKGHVRYEAAARTSEQWRDQHEFELHEALLTFKTSRFDFLVGQTALTWGRGDFINPTDVMHPSDLRHFVTEEFGTTKRASLIGQVNYYPGKFFLSLTALPLFEPMRVSLVGSDWGFLRLPLATRINLQPFVDVNQDAERLFREADPRIIQRVEEVLLRSGARHDELGESSFAFRTGASISRTAFSLTYAYVWDYLPAMQVGEAFDRALADGVVNALDLLGVLPGLLDMGDAYHRTHVIGADFETVVGSYTLRAEAAYYSDRTQFVANLSAVVKPWVWWVAGVDRTFPENHYLNVQVSGAHILDAEGLEFSQFRENHFILTALYQGRFLREKLRPELRGLYSPTTEDYFVSPRVGYSFNDHLTLTLGANFLEGESDTLFGQFTRNDQVFLLFEYSL